MFDVQDMDAVQGLLAEVCYEHPDRCDAVQLVRYKT